MNALKLESEPVEFDRNGQPVLIGPDIQIAGRLARKVFLQQHRSLTERQSWSAMDITVIRGECVVAMDDNEVLLKAHERLEIPAHVNHQIVAVEDLEAVVCFGH